MEQGVARPGILCRPLLLAGTVDMVLAVAAAVGIGVSSATLNVLHLAAHSPIPL